MVLARIEPMLLMEVEELEDTERGPQGFGHTGI
jgi:dUTPase